MKLPDNIPEYSKDWPVIDMIELAKKNVEWEERHNPSGMQGAMILFTYSSDRVHEAEGMEESDINPHLWFKAGLTIAEAIDLIDRVKNRLIFEMIKNEILDSKEDDES